MTISHLQAPLRNPFFYPSPDMPGVLSKLSISYHELIEKTKMQKTPPIFPSLIFRRLLLRRPAPRASSAGALAPRTSPAALASAQLLQLTAQYEKSRRCNNCDDDNIHHMNSPPDLFTIIAFSVFTSALYRTACSIRHPVNILWTVHPVCSCPF